MADNDTEHGGGSGGTPDADAIGIAAVEGAINGDFGEHIVIDPAKVGGAGSGGNSDNGESRPRGRGRPRGSRNGAKATKPAPLDLDAISGVLYNIHAMGATILSAPRLAIDEGEAKHLAGALKEVQKHYNIPMTEKAIAWTNLAGVAAMIYGPRIFAVRNDRAKERAAKKASMNGAAPDVAPGAFTPAPPFVANAGGFN